MPIRMTDDPGGQQDEGGGGRRGPSFPGGGGAGLLPLLLSLFKGKGIIVLLALAAGAYFLFNRGGGCNLADVVNQFSQSGYDFNPAEFNKASVYEELDEENPGNAIPEAVSLLR